jgi:aldehyde dehydrogenase (NAD+)
MAASIRRRWRGPALAAGLSLTGSPSAQGPRRRGLRPPIPLTSVTSDLAIVLTQKFGLVRSIIPPADGDCDVRIANDSDNGLAAALWTADVRRAVRMTKAIRGCTIGINGTRTEPDAALLICPPIRARGRPSRAACAERETVVLPLAVETM